jgi:hypothetical protein
MCGSAHGHQSAHATHYPILPVTCRREKLQKGLVDPTYDDGVIDGLSQDSISEEARDKFILTTESHWQRDLRRTHFS